MNQSVNLLLLLSLRNDSATELDNEGIPTLLREGSDRDGWRQLDSLLAESAQAELASPLNESTVAAYLEGALSTPEAAEVEAVCWRHPLAMQELASIHRDLNEPLVEPTISSSLHSRLLSLVPQESDSTTPERVNGTPTSTAPPAASEPTPDEVEPVAAAPPVDLPANPIGDSPPVAPPKPPPAVRPEASLVHVDASSERGIDSATSTVERLRHQQQGNITAIWWAAGLAVIATVTLLIVWAQQSGQRGDAPENREIAAPPDYETLDPESPQQPEPDQNEPHDPGGGSELGASTVDGDAAPPDRDPLNPPTSPLRDPPLREPKENPQPNRPSRPRPPSYPAIAFAWSEIEGLVVAKAEESSPWSGAQAEVVESSANQIATLPGSWATARTNRYGEIVFDANTHLTLVADNNDDTPAFEVRHGRLAFRDTPADTEFEFRTGVQHFSVQAPKSSSFAVVYGAGGPQVWVRRGKLQMGSTSIRKGQYVRWDKDAFTGAEKLKEGTAWFDAAPLERIRLDKPSQKMLLQSPNVFADLARLSQDGSKEVKAAAASWNVMLNPIGHLHRGLSSPNRLVRLQTLRWFHSQDPRDRRMALIWRRLGQDTGDFNSVRQVNQWGKRLWLGQPLDAPTALQMVQGLSNNDGAIRQLAISYLELNFGHRFQFNPAMRPATQRQAITLWTQYVRTHFSNPRNQR